MGALNGSLGYLRFLVEGDVAKNAGSAYEKALESRRFLPLSPTGDVMESAGWVPIESPFDDELGLTRDTFLFGDIIAVAYREDVFRIPRALLKRKTKERIDKIIREEKRDPESVGKNFVKAVEQAVMAELKAQTIPRTKLVDVVWDTAIGELRVFGRGTIATERVSSLFERTFQVKVELGTYAARAFTVDIGSRAMGVLERLSPGWLFPDAIKRDPTIDGENDDDDAEARDAKPAKKAAAEMEN